MNRWVVVMMLLGAVLMGCADHFQKVKGDQVYLYLKHRDTRSAYFACSLDGYQRHPITRADDSTWIVTLPADKEFSYFYIIEDQLFIPDCRFKENDDFGSENCIFMPDL